MSEERELLARIGELAGQINQHRNQNQNQTRGSFNTYPSRGGGRGGGRGVASPGVGPAYTSYTRGYGWAPYRGRGRGGRQAPVRAPVAHRNRTLVLKSSNNASAQPTVSPVISTAAPAKGTPAATPQQTHAQPAVGWVAKRDRHMQLINPAIYEKDAETRRQAIEETRRLKAQKRAEREKAKVLHHAKTLTAHQTVAPPTTSHQKPNAARSYTISIQGIPFQIANGGSKLIRLSSEPSYQSLFSKGTALHSTEDLSVTPRKVSVGGVTFIRSKTGNLHRLGAIVSKKKTRAVKKKNELCKRFTSTGTCYKGPSCRYIHDPNKVAICKEFLQTGNCPSGAACDLSHDPKPERTPACVHFLRGRCTNDNCRYAHVRVNPGAPVCREFAILGYCDKGVNCMEKHVHECPDYANKGYCPNKKCTLPHIDRAGQIRKQTANKTENMGEDGGEGDDEDISSDEEASDQIDSDDVSSDEEDVDEPVLILPGEDTGEIAAQQDFIGF